MDQTQALPRGGIVTQTSALVLLQSSPDGDDLQVTSELDDNAKRLSALRFNRTAIMAALLTSGVEWAQVEYQGCGDSGEVCDVSFADDRSVADVHVIYRQQRHVFDHDRNAWVTTTSDEQVSLEQALNNFADDAIEQFHGGYENGSGGGGTIYFNPSPEHFAFEKYDVYVERDSSDVEF